MKNLWLSFCVLVSLTIAACSEPQEPDNGETIPDDAFAKGADISWVTEMEADGVKFHNEEGKETDCFILMKELGMEAIRLRVWVNPEKQYGDFSNLKDVVSKSSRAKDAGMDLMIDFHYSDFFADPGRQDKPAAWKDKSMTELKEAVSGHTAEVLNALKSEGINPKWIQIGNETRNGMLWSDGQLWTESGDIRDGWKNYVGLSNAGYDAAKSVFPDALIIVHQNNAWEDLDWWFGKFREAGGKFDMIGLSHYPQSESDKTWQTVNQLALNNIESLGKTHGCKVMVVETGVKTAVNESTAALALKEFMTKAMNIEACAGVFYWEPQTDGLWKPSYYNELGWKPYDMGAFRNGRPTSILDAFRN